MNAYHRFALLLALAFALIVSLVPTAAVLRADNSQRPLQTHDFTDVPVAGKEFMEPFINAFYHQGVTTGCSQAPLMYCPEAGVTRGEMAVFMGRALGYRQAELDLINAEAYFKQTTAGSAYHGVVGSSVDGSGLYGTSTNGYGVYAASANATGLYAAGNGDVATDTLFDLELGGALGEIASQSMQLFSDSGFIFDLDNNNGENDT